MGLFSSIVNGIVTVVTGIVETVVTAVATAIAAPTIASVCGAIAAVGLTIAGGFALYKIGSKIVNKVLGTDSSSSSDFGGSSGGSSSGGSATIGREASKENCEEAHREFCDYYGIENNECVSYRRPESYRDVADAVATNSRGYYRGYDRYDYDDIDFRHERRHPFEDRFSPRYYEPIGIGNRMIDIDECIVDGKKVKTNKPKKKKHKKFKGIKDVAKYESLFDGVSEKVVDDYFDHHPIFGGDGHFKRYDLNTPAFTIGLN